MLIRHISISRRSLVVVKSLSQSQEYYLSNLLISLPGGGIPSGWFHGTHRVLQFVLFLGGIPGDLHRTHRILQFCSWAAFQVTFTVLIAYFNSFSGGGIPMVLLISSQTFTQAVAFPWYSSSLLKPDILILSLASSFFVLALFKT